MNRWFSTLRFSSRGYFAFGYFVGVRFQSPSEPSFRSPVVFLAKGRFVLVIPGEHYRACEGEGNEVRGLPDVNKRKTPDSLRR